MRTSSLMLLILTAGSLFAATNQEATYVVGNLDGLSAGATGYVRVENDGLTFHSGKVTIETPCAKITSTELGPKLTHSSDGSRLKFWELKRLSNKTIYQNLTVNFKNSAGIDRNMTLELTESAALEIQNLLDIRTGAKARQQQEWWGDDIWKTPRNQKTWETQTAALDKK